MDISNNLNKIVHTAYSTFTSILLGQLILYNVPMKLKIALYVNSKIYKKSANIMNENPVNIQL